MNHTLTVHKKLEESDAAGGSDALCALVEYLWYKGRFLALVHFTGNWSLAKGKVGVGWLADGIPRSGMRLRVCIVGRGGGTIWNFVKCNLKPLCHRKPLLVRVVEWATVTAWSSSRRYFSDGKGNTEVVDEGKEVSAGSYWLRRPHILYGRSLLFFALFHFSVFLGRWQSSMAAL